MYKREREGIGCIWNRTGKKGSVPAGTVAGMGNEIDVTGS